MSKLLNSCDPLLATLYDGKVFSCPVMRIGLLILPQPFELATRHAEAVHPDVCVTPGTHSQGRWWSLQSSLDASLDDALADTKPSS